MKFLLILVLSAIAGTAVAWTINEQSYGDREAYFGPMGLEGEVTAENVIKHVSKQWPTRYPHAELVGGNVHHFGVMAPGEKGSHTFTIRNTGESNLSLKLGASTCKCTFGNLEDNELPPGEQTEIKLQWTVKTNADRFSQSAEILTNDPERVAIPLKIEGQVVRDLEFQPSQWAFGEVAAGEPIELEAKAYNYSETKIEPTEVKFSTATLNERAEIQVTEFEPGEADGVYSEARQGFQIRATIAPGLRQGPISDNFSFGYRRVEPQGDTGAAQASGSGPEQHAVMPVTGRIVGALSMVTSSRLDGVPGGGYVYDFGRLDADDPSEAVALVMLKGSHRQDTQLSVGETSPPGVVQARLEQGQSRGKMTLYRLHLDLVPGQEPIERLGKNDDDYGWVWIESDNPAVPPMKLLLKFALPAK